MSHYVSLSHYLTMSQCHCVTVLLCHTICHTKCHKISNSPFAPGQVELHEASPRLGRVMGIAGGQQESDTAGPDTLSQEEITDSQEAAEKSEVEEDEEDEEVAVGLAAGKPWPVSSAASGRVINFSLLFLLSLLGPTTRRFML